MNYDKALRTCRAIRGWDQETVAKRAGLSTSYVSLIETGKRFPSPSAVKKLAKGLLVPESLFTLLGTDFSSLPLGEGKTFDQLARSLLSLLSQVENVGVKRS